MQDKQYKTVLKVRDWDGEVKKNDVNNNCIIYLFLTKPQKFYIQENKYVSLKLPPSLTGHNRKNIARALVMYAFRQIKFHALLPQSHAPSLI